MSLSERQAAGAVLLAAIAFAAISIFTIIATRDGTTLSMFMLVRFGVAALVLGIPARRELLRPWTAQTGRVFVAGAIGQSLVGVLSLASLRWIPAATLVVLFYTFPAWVTLGAAWRGSEPLTPARTIALLLSLTGILLLVGWPGSSAIDPLGASLALAAAVVYAIYIPIMRKVQVGIGSLHATWLISVGVTIVFAVAAVLRGEFTLALTPAAWAASVATGIFSTALGLLFFLRGLAVLGSVRTSILSTIEPIVAAAMASVVLGQPITRPMVVGGAFIMAAVVIIASGPAVAARQAARP